jgi:hypothetical protein
MNANELAEILESDSKHTSGRFTYSSRYIADIATMLRQQQAEIEALKATIISENEACAQILLDFYDTTEPYESISPDWLLTLVDLIDDRVGRVRT